jgi:hypothetical protein
MGEIINDESTEQIIEAGAAGAPEGTRAPEPAPGDVQKMYDELGIKATAPTGKPKGRPKTSGVRDEDDSEDGTGNSASGKSKNDDDKGKSKDAPASGKNGDSGDKVDPKKPKDGKDAGQVQGKPGETDKAVHGAKSKGEGDSERGSEEDAELGTDGTGQKAHDESGSEEEGQADEKGKRPGKSNPEVEKRMQQLTAEKREALERAERAEKQLQEATRKQEQARVSQEDPEYTIDDFRKVRDREGNIIDLDPERAELAWRRWKDGYDQRAEERQARENREAAMAAREEATTQEVMQKSVQAYDTLAALMDEYPELVSGDKFDPEFAAEAMPIIQESIEYLPGTEPGNPDDNLPVITGLRIDPKKILAALKNIGSKKRTLPLNGANDNVESRSNVSVPHSRSSDPTVNAANQLYQELGIDKRI